MNTRLSIERLTPEDQLELGEIQEGRGELALREHCHYFREVVQEKAVWAFEDIMCCLISRRLAEHDGKEYTPTPDDALEILRTFFPDGQPYWLRLGDGSEVAHIRLELNSCQSKPCYIYFDKVRFYRDGKP